VGTFGGLIRDENLEKKISKGVWMKRKKITV
jgi:hypothetical protein